MSSPHPRVIVSSDTKKAASDKNYVRIVRDINAMDADSRAVATELDGARHDHTAANNSLMDEEQRTLMVEQKLRVSRRTDGGTEVTGE